MKQKITKIKKNLFPVSIIILVSLISNMYEFNYMNYDFFINKYIFTSIMYVFILINTINKNKLDNINLDTKYLFNLHILLNVIWIFLFFLYKNFFYSLFSILFSLIILVLYLKKKFTNNTIFNSIYILWYCYLVIINFLIL